MTAKQQYNTFESWWNEIEGFATRAERYAINSSHEDSIAWMRAAFNAARAAETETRINSGYTGKRIADETADPREGNEASERLKKILDAADRAAEKTEATLRDGVEAIRQITKDMDPTPWCHQCGALVESACHCGPIADNN